MALLNKLKSLLGIGASRGGDERTDTSVTVEREASAASTNRSHEEPTTDKTVDTAGGDTDTATSTGSTTESETVT